MIRRLKHSDFYVYSEDVGRSINVYWNDFLENSTVHGLRYTRKQHKKWRYVWFAVILVSFGLAAWMSSLLWYRYSSTPIMSTLLTSHYPSSMSKFSAVTVCDQGIRPRKINDFLASMKYTDDITPREVEEALPEIKTSFDKFSNVEVLEKKQKIVHKILEYNYLTPRDAMRMLSSPCREILLHCRWEGAIVPCEEIFQSSLSSFGYCCTFDLGKIGSRHNQNGSTWHFGPDFGLSLILQQTPSLLVVVHNPLELPWSGNDDGYTLVRPRPAETTLLEVNSKLVWHSQGVLDLPIESRKCIQDIDMQLNYFPNYSSASCVSECRVNASLALCGCAPYNSPVEDVMVCGMVDLLCLSDHYDIIYSLNLVNEDLEDDEELEEHGDDEKDAVKSCSCWHKCESIDFHVHAQQVPLNAIHSDTSDFLKLVNNLSQESVVHIYNAKQTVVVWEKRLMYSWVHFLSNVGGIASLFLGCSLITLVEVLYYCCIKAFLKNSTKSLPSLDRSSVRGRLNNDDVRDIESRDNDIGIRGTGIEIRSKDIETRGKESVKKTIFGPSLFDDRKINARPLPNNILSCDPQPQEHLF